MLSLSKHDAVDTQREGGIALFPLNLKIFCNKLLIAFDLNNRNVKHEAFFRDAEYFGEKPVEKRGRRRFAALRIKPMPTVQVKTLEQLIVRTLQTSNETANLSFQEMLRHFSNEEYLYDVEHTEIIKMIYTQDYYKTHSAGALAWSLHIDVKTLLGYRKDYVRLFAKFYLGLTQRTPFDFMYLYQRLKEALEKEEK